MKLKLLGCGGAAAVLVVLLAVGGMVAGSYNQLVTLEEGVGAAWSQVENVYQRRADLVPNLVATVQGAADFERETLQSVIEARARVGQTVVRGTPNAQQLREFDASQGALDSALSRLLVVVERYPQLRATDAFRDLQAQLEGTENRIAVERRRFNEAAQSFNTARRRFPTVLVAGLMGFEEKPYFEARAGTSAPPQVEFGQDDGG